MLRIPIILGCLSCSVLILSGCGGDDDFISDLPSVDATTNSMGPNCRALQQYYDNCCYTCGPSDSYCSGREYDVRGLTEPRCASDLAGIDTRYCYCDVF